MAIRFKNTITGKIYTQLFDNQDCWSCPTDKVKYSLKEARDNPHMIEIENNNLPKGHPITEFIDTYEAIKESGGNSGDVFLLLDKRYIVTKKPDEFTDYS